MTDKPKFKTDKPKFKVGDEAYCVMDFAENLVSIKKCKILRIHLGWWIRYDIETRPGNLYFLTREKSLFKTYKKAYETIKRSLKHLLKNLNDTGLNEPNSEFLKSGKWSDVL